MRRQFTLVVAPVVAVVAAASVAHAAPSRTDHFNDPKLDKLHAVRPTATSPGSSPAAVPDPASGLIAAQQAAVAQHAADAAAAQAAADAAAALAAAAPSGPVNGVLACIRQRESGGDYSVHNSGGSGAAGAYQIMPDTWNRIAAASGRADLVGLDPAAAPPPEQDAMAQALYAQQGAAPWGGSC